MMSDKTSSEFEEWYWNKYKSNYFNNEDAKEFCFSKNLNGDYVQSHIKGALEGWQASEAISEKRIEELTEELDVSDGVINLMSKLLAKLTLIVKGESLGLERHGSHDLPELVEKIKQINSELEAQIKHWKSNHDYQVQRARLVMARPDLDLERIKAWDRTTLDNFIALETALRALYDVIIEQNRLGANWHDADFGKMMTGLSLAKQALATTDKG